MAITEAWAKLWHAAKVISERCNDGFLAASSGKGPSAIIPATGRKIRFDVQARGRFVDDKMAERWDRADFEDIKRQLTGPTQ